MQEIIVASIGIIGTISSIIFAYLAFKRNEKGTIETSAKSEGALLSDIGYIKSSIDRMEQKLDHVEANYQDLLTRKLLVLIKHLKTNSILKMHMHQKRQILFYLMI